MLSTLFTADYGAAAGNPASNWGVSFTDPLETVGDKVDLPTYAFSPGKPVTYRGCL